LIIITHGGDNVEFEDQHKEVQKMDHEKNDDIDQKEEAQTPPVDPFTGLMFGTRSSGRNNDQQQTNTEMDDVNYFTLLEQIDDIMVSLKNLKPMLEPLSPLIDYIKKKI
jgi:hypothetical protein